MLPQTAFPPISSVLHDRKLALVLAGAAGLQLTLVSLSLPGWECPIFRITGIPCPGCGLSRAVTLLLRGDFKGSFRYHAFAPILLLSIVAVILAAFLPKSITQPIVSKAEQLEGKTKLTVIILSGLFLYWLARLLFMQSAFVQLIRG
ncbi:MAG: DUF2752 domain-containing protein [Acidobacteriota bacterium]|nr:DUF2752 domain-containing protein [Acidobacteriota bacterium]